MNHNVMILFRGKRAGPDHGWRERMSVILKISGIPYVLIMQTPNLCDPLIYVLPLGLGRNHTSKNNHSLSRILTWKHFNQEALSHSFYKNPQNVLLCFCSCHLNPHNFRLAWFPLPLLGVHSCQLSSSLPSFLNDTNAKNISTVCLDRKNRFL